MATPFNFVALLDAHGIDYVTSGPYVTEGNIGIRCPFCKSSDTGYHLGIEIKTGRWNCWRDAAHRGRQPVKLVQRLLACTWEQAELVVESGTTTLHGWSGFVEALRHGELDVATDDVQPLNAIEHDPDLVLISNKISWMAPAIAYLKLRGFSRPVSFARRYGLRYARSGKWKQRIVFPIECPGVGLIGWTARAIGSSRYRYLAHPGPQIKRVLFNGGNVLDGDMLLVLCEGPLDALTIDWSGEALGVRAVALGGTTATDGQVQQLIKLAPLFTKFLVVLDQAAAGQALALQRRLRFLDADVHIMQSHADPGDMNERQATAWCRPWVDL